MGFTLLAVFGNDFANFIHHGVVHFAVQQHTRCIRNQPLGPHGHHHCANDASHRVQPHPPIDPATHQRHNGQHRSGRIGHHMHIGRSEVQVMVVRVVVVVVCMAAMSVVAMTVMVCCAQYVGAHQINNQAHSGDDDGLLVVNRLG